jgi:hypothetical protein
MEKMYAITSKIIIVVWFVVTVLLVNSACSKPSTASVPLEAQRIEVIAKDEEGRWTVYRDTKTGIEYMKVPDGGLIRLGEPDRKDLSEMLHENP